MATCKSKGLSPLQRATKRGFDLVVSFVGLVLTGWVILLAWLLASVDTRRSGFFLQDRIGMHGRPIKVLKIRTMRDHPGLSTTVTTSSDIRVTRLGSILRKTKIDELPQLINVFLGQMSFVGPRPDVAGFADQLHGDDRLVLSVRPGITGPATLKYRNEEELLGRQEDPERFNREVIFPDKVRINREYVLDYSFLDDLKLILRTLIGSERRP
jgi:lipopolysaccharide/colanic/teichoic acid biosynthesis glycosyltransferase